MAETLQEFTQFTW